MNRRIRSLLILLTALAAVCVVSAAAADAWDMAFESGNGRLEQVSLLPESYEGFSAGEALTEEQAQDLFRDAVPVSLGPDGAVLWFSGGETPAFFVQRDHEIVFLVPAPDRGTPDPDGKIQESLSVCLSWVADGRFDSPEWSPDGRYVLFQPGGAPNWFPCLMDAQTGEVFLVYGHDGPEVYPQEEGAAYSFSENAHFSPDGRYLDLMMCVVFQSEEDGSVRSEGRGAFARYELESGTLINCGFAGETCRFDEIGEDRFLAVSSPARIISLDESGAAQTSDWPDSGLFSLRILSGMSGPAAALLSPDSSKAYWLALSVLRNEPAWSNEWLLMPVDADVSGPFRMMTAEELTEPLRSGGSPAGYRRFIRAVPVLNTPYILLLVTDNISIENWYAVTQANAQWVLLNTETLEAQPLQYDRIWTYEDLRNTVQLYADTAVYGDTLLVGGHALRLNPDADPAADPVLSALDRLEVERSDRLDAFLSLNTYVTDVSARSMEILARYSLPDVSLLNTVEVLEDRYRITLTFETAAPLLIPDAVTEERYAELRERMSPKVRKKFQNFYTKVTPENLEKREDRDELLAKYPSVGSRTLYILKRDLNAAGRVNIEQALQEAGYTAEDYAADLQNVSPDAATEYTQNIEIQYLFVSDNRSVRWTAGPTTGLVMLMDYLASTVYNNCLTAGSAPASFDSLPLQGDFEYACIPYRVTLDNVREEEGLLALVFTAVPAGDRGWYFNP